MAIDFEKIRKKVAQLSGDSGNDKKKMFWKPEEGEHQVRLLPFTDNDGQPFKELHFYYDLVPYGILTLHQFGEDDPVQEMINNLRDEGTDETFAIAKKLYPSMRCYAPVIVRGEESKGVRLWSFGYSAYKELLALFLDDDYGDITDTQDGTDLKLTFKKNPKFRNPFLDNINPRRKSSVLSQDAQQVTDWLDATPDPLDYFEKKSYDEIAKILSDWINGGTSDSGNDGSTRGGKSAEKTTSKYQS